MSHRFVKRLAFAAVVVGAVGLAAASSADARPVRRAGRQAASAFNLFAATTMSIEINRIYCGLRAIGEICVDVSGSPVLGGGSWPRGSGNAYIFNSGLQIAGVISPSAPFAWAGDTVGSWFMDPRGDQQSGEGVTDIYSSLNAADVAAWPSAANILDTALYNANLIGRPTISQQDIWWRYWDANPNQTAGRGHPAGILVEQRGLGWNFPSGNEDILYFITRFINVTADGSTAAGRAKYDVLSRFGYTPAQIDEIAALGTRFQQLNEAKFAVSIPDEGYAIEEVFAAVMMDPDVGTVVTDNYSTANLVFSLAFAYVGDFEEATWQYPSNINSAPFGNNPGFVGVKYLQTPKNPLTGFEFGISMFSNTTNGAPFPDANGIQQLYRYLSGNASAAAGDNDCTVPNPQQNRLCALVQTAADTRFFAASGPFTLNAGDGDVFVTAYVMAAPVAAPIAPYVGSAAPFLQPGFPPQPDSLVLGTDTARTIDRATGWVSHNDAGAQPGEVVQSEVTVVPRSLLGKSLVAQAVFDNGFLLPFAPEAPDFFLVPGDNQVTVVWQASPTETVGDPYAAVAAVESIPGPNPGDPLVANPLFDPNYRNIDVEGYRIWRGRTPSQMEVIAQFDYSHTTFDDNVGLLVNPDYGTQCAPDLGVTASCPGFPNAVPIASQEGFQPGLVQVAPGGRVVTLAGDVVVTDADTAVSGGAHCAGAKCPELTDTGVPFSFVDGNVRNGFRYYYSVTAFDVNSVTSVGKGNTSLESPLVTRIAAPRAGSNQEVTGVATTELIGGDGTVLTPGTNPGVNATTGIFAGPLAPTNGFELGFAAFLPNIVGAGNMTITVDSITPGSSLTGVRPTTYYLTRQIGTGTPEQFEMQVTPYGFDASTTRSTSAAFPAAFLGQSAASRFGGDSTYQLFANFSFTVPGIYGLTQKGRGDANDSPADSPNNGPRFWVGAGNEDVADPNGLVCPVTNPGTFGCVLGDLSRNAGQIAGVDIFSIQSYLTIGTTAPPRDIEGITSTVMRNADFKIYWGAAGAIDSVVDVTHRLLVPFDTRIRASWGVLNNSGFAATTAASTPDANNALLTWADYACVAPVPAYLNRCGGVAQTPAVLSNTAELNAVWFASSTYAGVAGQTTNGTGFILYLNGYFTMFRMAALPAAGTVWNARMYVGQVTGRTGSYAFADFPTPPAAPGLRMRLSWTGSTIDASTTTAANLERVHTVPDPYYVTNSLEFSGSNKVLRFVNLPAQAIIRIYSASGILVNIVSHNDNSGGGDATWNLRNRNNQFVASGVYFFHVETPDGLEKVGRFTVVNYAQ